MATTTQVWLHLLEFNDDADLVLPVNIPLLKLSFFLFSQTIIHTQKASRSIPQDANLVFSLSKCFHLEIFDPYFIFRVFVSMYFYLHYIETSIFIYFNLSYLTMIIIWLCRGYVVMHIITQHVGYHSLYSKQLSSWEIWSFPYILFLYFYLHRTATIPMIFFCICIYVI